MKNAKDITDPHGLRFLAAVKGVPAAAVGFALTTMTPGKNWRGCTKGSMAERYAEDQDPANPYRHLQNLDLETLRRRCVAYAAGDRNWRNA